MVTWAQCVVCGEETSGGHSCHRCFGRIYVIYGRPAQEEEGDEGSVVCPPCYLLSRRDLSQTRLVPLVLVTSMDV